MPRFDDIPSHIKALIPDGDWDCLFVGDEGDEEMESIALHLEYAMYVEGEFPHPELEREAWVQQAITANPGTWTARLCRAMHGVPETPRGIAYCGLCSQYANPRKRARDAARRHNGLLPGFEEIGGEYLLHPPCSRRGLTWLRHLIYRLRGRGQVETRREPRPDPHNHRGWDWMTTLYPSPSEYEE